MDSQVEEATEEVSLSQDEFDIMHWVEERAHCERDFPYFCRTYLQIKGRETMGHIPLVLNPLQEELWTRVCDQKRRLGYIRMVIGKQRQVGVSLFWQALGFWLTAFHNNRNGLVMAQDEPTAMALYDMYRTFYDCLPEPLRPEVGTMTRKKTEFVGRKSKMFMGHATNTNVGVSHTVHLLHISEAARYEHTDFIGSALFPALSDAKDFGETWNCSVAVVESAAFFPGHWFKAFGDAAIEGNDDWDFFFAPFYMTREYEAPVPDTFVPTPQEAEYLRAYPLLRHCHLMWRRKKVSEYTDNMAEFYRQYPMTWKEAWMLPEGTHRVFPRAALEATQNAVMRGTKMQPSDGGLVPMDGGSLEVWQVPHPGVFYDLGFDVAKGEAGLDPERCDFSVLEVIRRDTLEQVAEARGKWDPSSDFMSSLVYDTGMAYNAAQINPDVTSGWGHIVLAFLQRKAYPSIYCRRNRVTTEADNITKLAGLSFNGATKAMLVTTAVNMAHQGVADNMPLIVHSAVLFTEILKYLQVETGGWAPEPGYKDDCVTAWMLALLSAYDETVLIGGSGEPPRPPAVRRDPATSINIAAILNHREYPAIGGRRKWRARV